MSGQHLGYIRVSSVGQHPDRQLDGLVLDRVFTDRASGKDTQRPQLAALLQFARAGDTVVVHSMDRLARNLDDLRRLASDLTGRGVRVEFLKEGLTFTGDAAALSPGCLRGIRAGAAAGAPTRGHRLGETAGVYRGRKPQLTAAQISGLRQRVETGEPKARQARELGISRETLYQYLRTEA